MRVKIPSTNSAIVNGAKLDYLMSYPPQALLLDFFDYTGSVATISPRKNRNGVDDYVVAINNVLYESLYDGVLKHTVDLTATGINDTTKVGGLIDGITFVAGNGRDFLIWGLANDVNTEFDGFAVTHKPYSAYTSPAVANQGLSYAFTVTNGFQFTSGARVAVRNTVGTLPLYEWNWGTITSINSNTSITILMDNNANYGVNLTAVTGGEILQWDLFRPWVVGTTQEIYSDSYRLIGEMSTDTSGNISVITRADDPFRNITNTLIYNSTAQQAGTTFSIGRYVPLWTKSIDAMAIIKETSLTTGAFTVRNPINSSGISEHTQVVNVNKRFQGAVDPSANAQINVRGNSANISDYRVWVYRYYVPGGMRV